MNNKQKKVLFWVIVGLIIVLISLIFYRLKLWLVTDTTNIEESQGETAIMETNNTNGVDSAEETALAEEDIDTSDWLTYRNEEYGFEFKYPAGWDLDDCSELFISLDLVVILSDTAQDNCNIPHSGRIRIGTTDTVPEFENKKEITNFKIRNIFVANRQVKQISFIKELLGGEAEELSPKPLKKFITTYIPYRNNFIYFGYSELFYLKSNTESRGFEIEQDFAGIYKKMLSTIRFIQ